MQWRKAGIILIALAATLGMAPASANEADTSDLIPDQNTGAIPNELTGYQEVVTRGAAAQAPQGFAPCIRGKAARTYACDGIDMLAHIPLEDLGLTFGNDIWGWTDPRTRHDYALIGGTEGTVIVDITIPLRPNIVGTLPAHKLDPSLPFWRDIKVFDNHMFVGSEQRGHGLQVFDLTEVRGVRGPVTFEETAHYDEFDTSHNININPDTGFLYAVGVRNADRSANCGAGLHMVDINDPANPTFAGCFSDHGYIHDTQCVVYEGPDAEHHGKELCFNSNAASDGHFFSITDVTDKENPVALSRVAYENPGYSHQGWLTPDQKHFIHNDELDEVDHGLNTTLRVFDVSDVDDPQLPTVFEHPTTSIGHNLYTEGNVAYVSNYTSGLRVISTRNAPEVKEIAYFDLYPENDNASFEGGTWSNYPYFRQSKTVAVSSIDRGLFILRPRKGV